MRKCAVVFCVIVSLLMVTFGAVAQTNQAWIPGLGSLILPGLGQLLNDEMDKALIHFGVAVGIGVVGGYVSALLPFGWYGTGALYFGWALFSAFDAYSVADETGFTFGLTDNGIGFAYEF